VGDRTEYTNAGIEHQAEKIEDRRGLLPTRKFAATIAGIWQWEPQAMAAEGLLTIPSSFGPKETTDRLAAEIEAKGMTLFARIDHAAGAAEVGLPLRPTELLISGSAKVGTPHRTRTPSSLSGA